MQLVHPNPPCEFAVVRVRVRVQDRVRVQCRLMVQDRVRMHVSQAADARLGGDVG